MYFPDRKITAVLFAPVESLHIIFFLFNFGMNICRKKVLNFVSAISV